MSNTLTLLPAPQLPAGTEQPIILDELATGTFGIYNLSDIRISKTNRKRFNVLKLNELAASIKSKGVAQPILIRPVTPATNEPQKFEIVAGERRFRASLTAGLGTIPAMCRRLTDQEALELQILENLQRDNPHPLEEAEGYEQLMLKHGYNADQLADKLSKSRSYVYGRLKLCALNLEVREQFLDNEELLPASIALLIARIPVAALQTKALSEILRPNGLPSAEPMSYRRAKQWVQENYMLDLGRAVFPIKDSKLLPDAGNCTGCAKRAGNQPVVYEGVSPNVCTDPGCFAEKTAAHYVRLAAQARKAGMPVHEGEDADKLYRQIYLHGSEVVACDTPLYTFDRIVPGTGMAGHVKSHLSAGQLPPVVAYIKQSNGILMPLYSRAAVQEAFEAHNICETMEARSARQVASIHSPRQAGVSPDEDEETAEPETSDTTRAKALTAERVAIYRRLRPLTAGTMSITMMREMTKLLVRALPLPDDVLDDLYAFEDRSDDGICAYIDTAEHGQVQQILFDLVIGEHLSVESYNIDDHEESHGYEALQAMAAELPQEDVDHSESTTPQPQTDTASSTDEDSPGRPVLKLKTKETDAEQPRASGPIIKVKKVRTPVPADASWPFPA